MLESHARSHSHFFREIFRRFLHPSFYMTDSHLARTLQTKSIPNCTVLACDFDFSLKVRAVTTLSSS